MLHCKVFVRLEQSSIVNRKRFITFAALYSVCTASELFDEAIIDPIMYGQDSNSNESDNEDEDQSVVVPITHIPLSDYSKIQLRLTINLLQQCDDFGNNFF